MKNIKLYIENRLKYCNELKKSENFMANVLSQK